MNVKNLKDPVFICALIGVLCLFLPITSITRFPFILMLTKMVIRGFSRIHIVNLVLLLLPFIASITIAVLSLTKPPSIDKAFTLLGISILGLICSFFLFITIRWILPYMEALKASFLLDQIVLFFRHPRWYIKSGKFNGLGIYVHLASSVFCCIMCVRKIQKS